MHVQASPFPRQIASTSLATRSQQTPAAVRLRGFTVWQRANYEPFTGEMLQRRNLDDTSRCRNDANPPHPTTR